MKTLSKIQKIYKAVGVLARIAEYACFLYAICALAAAIVACAAGESSLAGQIRAHMNCETRKQVLATLFSDAAFAAANGLLALYVSRYARAELADDTPFTVRGADEMRALGVRAIVLPLVALIVSAILHKSFVSAILHKSFGAAPLSDIDGGLSAVIGVVLLLVSLLLRCGAEQTAEAR